ncbi:MAG TPA: succinate dehydrogenase/fumarate reductase iron-sulfur subunit [Acidothermaceae bacterium]|nr:succinate dehydrogenase/fumarate reductase iron-sulfur subunit [Acidothermaceae bacterium]
MGYDLKMRVWRGDENGGYLVDYTVGVEEGEVVLDAIHRLQATQAGDLAVRWNCKAGKCGSCSAEVNGRPRLLCMTRLSSYEPTDTITVTPMRTFPVLRDLVTDVSFNYEKARQVPAFTPPADLKPGDYRMQQVDVERSQEFRKCIECFLCQNTCHVVRDHEENKPAFAGPRFFIRYAELDMHPLDTVDRKNMLQEEQGLGLCNITKCCTEVCPEHIKITDNAIIPMKERVVDVKFDPWGKVMRTRREAEQPRSAVSSRSGIAAGAAGGASRPTAAPARTVLRNPPAPPAVAAPAAAAAPVTAAPVTAAPKASAPTSRAPVSHAPATHGHGGDMAEADRAVASRVVYSQTRVSLHGVAELLLAGPQRRANRSIKLVVTDDGFATGPLPRPPWLLAVRGTDLVVGDGTLTLPLHGTFADLAANAGVACAPPADAYPPASGCKGSDRLHVDPAAASELFHALALGDHACRVLAATFAAAAPPTPVLWPEHFDVGVALDEVNYGVSPGDDAIPEPYAYVGPHRARKGKFWNQPFGAARPMTEFEDADAVLAFFEEGRRQAADSAPAT